MKIRPEIEVFDDPKYCGCSMTENCSLLEDGDNKYFCLWSNGKIALGQNKDKHDQCKADYLKAKREDPADRIIADALQERGNQDAVWGGPEHDDLHDPRDWVHFIRVYATKAKMEDSKSNHSKYKHRMIQIIALGVSAILSFNRKEKDGETQ